MKTPSLLSPAGSFDALVAGISCGADELYFGGATNNARINAKNFDENEFAEALKLCNLYHVKSNITLNTLVSDREMKDALSFAYHAICLGADSFIVQDIGLARILKQNIPEIELHASTQCACHNSDGAKQLHSLGFSRIVLARELPLAEIKKITDDGINGYETELFLHGALCVSHSGMCLMSSCIGKRSGNRGLCAQPCRLPYSMNEGAKKELLSLKDLSLASHMTELLSLGVAALKIEGRMKSPEYVAGVTKLYRTLLDEKRNATLDEMSYLQELFSRNGFTDRYFTGNYKTKNSDMYGIRSETQKRTSAFLKENIVVSLPKLPLSMECEILAEKSVKLKAEYCGISALYIAPFTAAKAEKSPLTVETVSKNLKKLGSTHFCIDDSHLQIKLDDGLFLTAAQINELRRFVISELEQKIIGEKKSIAKFSIDPERVERRKSGLPQFRIYFNSIHQCTKEWEPYKPLESIVYPLSCFRSLTENEIFVLSHLPVPFGVKLPRVIYNDEIETAKGLLKRAKDLGADYCEVSNIGQIELGKSTIRTVYGGIGLNIYNSECIGAFQSMGVSSLTLSPELGTAQMRDIMQQEMKIAVCVSGRLPLMVLESCIRKANGKCSSCRKEPYLLCDRMNFQFPVIPEERFSGEEKACRNIIYNSVSLDLLKNEEKLRETGAQIYCIFEDVI